MLESLSRVRSKCYTVGDWASGPFAKAEFILVPESWVFGAEAGVHVALRNQYAVTLDLSFGPLSVNLEACYG